MNHALIESKPGELGVGCKCGKRFPTRKTAEGHVADQNLIEANEAKAQAAAAELEHQAKEPVDPEPPRPQLPRPRQSHQRRRSPAIANQSRSCRPPSPRLRRKPRKQWARPICRLTWKSCL
jgi:hypothetical protein